MSYLAVGISILITLAYEKFNTCKICIFQAAVAYIKKQFITSSQFNIFLAPPLNCVCVCGGGGGYIWVGEIIMISSSNIMLLLL